MGFICPALRSGTRLHRATNISPLWGFQFAAAQTIAAESVAAPIFPGTNILKLIVDCLVHYDKVVVFSENGDEDRILKEMCYGPCQ
jgi:hypothetical protein